jgi:hypothetical protein
LLPPVEDSDDERAADPLGPNYPTQRPKNPWWHFFLEMDIYGIDPQLMIMGKEKFRSCWGLFFSLLMFSSVLYFSAMKGLFYYYNQTTQLIQ